jgi:hypothetical protein
LNAGLGGHRVWRDGADNHRLRLECRHVRALIQHERHHHEREHDVHQRAHDQDLESLPLGFGQELVGGARAGVLRVLSGHLHVAAERNGADGVLGVAAPERQELRAKPE